MEFMVELKIRSNIRHEERGCGVGTGRERREWSRPTDESGWRERRCPTRKSEEAGQLLPQNSFSSTKVFVY